MNLKRFSIVGLIAACVIAGTAPLAYAQTSTTTATTSPAVSAYLSQLQILRQLQQGMSGDDIITLQTYLSTQPDIYPEGLITGFYGALTSKAVAKLQKKLGLPSVGRVGPMTLALINRSFSTDAVSYERKNGTTTACVKIPPGHLIAPGQLKKRGNQPLLIPICQDLPSGIAKKLGRIGTTTATTTPPAIPAPVISSITATSTATTTATISWATNIFTIGKVWFGTTTPITSTSTMLLSTTTNGVIHGRTLTGLTASTTYYFLISAINTLGVTATSSQQSVTTVSS